MDLKKYYSVRNQKAASANFLRFVSDKEGILVAVRIGEKRVRRFRKEDLVKFLEEAAQ